MSNSPYTTVTYEIFDTIDDTDSAVVVPLSYQLPSKLPTHLTDVASHEPVVLRKARFGELFLLEVATGIRRVTTRTPTLQTRSAHATRSRLAVADLSTDSQLQDNLG